MEKYRMKESLDIRGYWKAVLTQDAALMKEYFQKDAVVSWHCTNERFTVDEFIRANCEYPGKWDGTIERLEQLGNLLITVVCVYSVENDASFHVVSFFGVEQDKIVSLDEYWGDDGIAPQWRLEKQIGTSILTNRNYLF